MSKGKWKKNENTKKAMAEAFKNLSQKKDLNKITVKDITDYCNINRNTFYYHFEDIYSLIKWIFEEETSNVIKNFNHNSNKELITMVINYVEDNKYILNCIFNSYGRELLRKLFYDNFYKTIDNIIIKYENENNNSIHIIKTFRIFLIDFYCEAFASSIINYFRNSYKINKEELIYNLVVMFNSLSSILKGIS